MVVAFWETTIQATTRGAVNASSNKFQLGNLLKVIESKGSVTGSETVVRRLGGMNHTCH